MAKKKSIIPEFMVNNPEDTFQFLFPLQIVLDEDKFGNSHYEVVVKNMSKNGYLGTFGKNATKKFKDSLSFISQVPF